MIFSILFAIGLYFYSIMYGIYCEIKKLFFGKKLINDILYEYDIKNNLDNNTEIIKMMKHLGYYNINIGNEIESFIMLQIKHITNVCIIDRDNRKTIIESVNNFIKNNPCCCKNSTLLESKNMGFEEININEILNIATDEINEESIIRLINYIKSSKKFLKFKNNLSSKISRSVELSKFVNIDCTEWFYDALSRKELYKLYKSYKLKINKYFK